MPEGSPDIEKEDDYKPEFLHDKKSPLTIQVDASKTARSDVSLVPEENSTINRIKSLKEGPATNTISKSTQDASNIIAHDDVLNNEEMDNLVNPILYVRGVASDCFYLILAGRVMICSGNEGFFVEQGAFNYMGVECLTNDNYVPDFSAKVIGKAKLLKVTRDEYRKSL